MGHREVHMILRVNELLEINLMEASINAKTG